MAWNRPTENQTRANAQNRGNAFLSKANALLLCVICTITVVIATVVVISTTRIEIQPSKPKKIPARTAKAVKNPRKTARQTGLVPKNKTNKDRIDLHVSKIAASFFDAPPIETTVEDREDRNPSLNPRTFKTGTEQILDWIFNCRVGDCPMPIPSIDEDIDLKDLANILTTRCAVCEQDDERTAERKWMVDAAKDEMLEYLNQGGTANGFLRYYFEELKHLNQVWMKAQDLAEEIAAEGDIDSLGYYVDRANKVLEMQGIKPIELDDEITKQLRLRASHEEG